MEAHGKLVYPYRDMRYIILSQYYYYLDPGHPGPPELQKLTPLAFLNNEGGFQNKVVKSWAQSYVSWTAQRAYTMFFAETELGLPDVWQELSEYLGRAPSLSSFALDVRKIKPAITPVSRFAGKGTSGWTKFSVSAEWSEQIHEVARRKLELAHLNVMSCELQWQPRFGFGTERGGNGILQHLSSGQFA